MLSKCIGWNDYLSISSCIRLFAIGLLVIAVSPSLAQQRQSSALGDSDRQVSLRTLPSNLIADQKDIWLFPAKLAKGQHWIPTVPIVGVTSALAATDPNTAPSFRTTNSFSGYNRVLSGTNTGAFIAAVPASMYAIGLIKKDSYTKR